MKFTAMVIMYQIPLISKLMQEFQSTAESVVGIRAVGCTQEMHSVLCWAGTAFVIEQEQTFSSQPAYPYQGHELHTSVVLVAVLLFS